jgi:hypothetical protein
MADSTYKREVSREVYPDRMDRFERVDRIHTLAPENA